MSNAAVAESGIENPAADAVPAGVTGRTDSVPVDPEAFIPFSRKDLVELCLEDGGLNAADATAFRRFAGVLTSWMHFAFHETGETIKNNYAPLNPDTAVRQRDHTAEDLADKADEMIGLFRHVAERANYREIPRAQIESALDMKTLVDVSTSVDLDDFEHIAAFSRGDIFEPFTTWEWFRKVTRDVDVYQRVVLLFRFKDAAYFARKPRKRRQRRLPFEPGKIYLFLYKNVPKYDIELLFPNIEIGMSTRDRLLVGIPAIGAGIGVLLRVLPKVLIVIGVILFFTMGPSFSERLGVGPETIENFLPVLTAILALTVAFGGLAFKQYNNFKNKKISFQANIMDALFFRNLATNISVVHRLVDQAEEAECKEILLVTYHLLANRDRGMTRAELDAHIEDWMRDKFGHVMDFDIDGPIDNLMGIRANIDGVEKPLLTVDDNGVLRILPLHDSCRVLDRLWDDAFDFDSSRPAAAPA